MANKWVWVVFDQDMIAAQSEIAQEWKLESSKSLAFCLIPGEKRSVDLVMCKNCPAVDTLSGAQIHGWHINAQGILYCPECK